MIPNGTKKFCFGYTFGAKFRLLSLRPVPILSLADARDRGERSP
jgi:hypothetical protein